VPTPNTYDYAWLRVVPRVETGEYLNVGVILYCRTLRFLDVRVHIDRARVSALAPTVDLEELHEHLVLIKRMCDGEGAIGALGQAETFHWVVAPHSTVIQSSPVHSGLCTDPQQTLEQLARQLVPA
jgi:hypothetical protein